MSSFPLLCATSPFKVKSMPGHDASKVRASGPGLDTKGVSASIPVEFTIDARDAGEGLLTVQILVGGVPRTNSTPSALRTCLYFILYASHCFILFLFWFSGYNNGSEKGCAIRVFLKSEVKIPHWKVTY